MFPFTDTFDTQFGRKFTLVPGTLLVATAIASLPFATSIEHMWGSVFLWGLGNCVLGSTPTAYMADITDLKVRSQALALLRTGMEAVAMCGGGAAVVTESGFFSWRKK